jgi:hypothetical protein
MACGTPLVGRYCWRCGTRATDSQAFVTANFVARSRTPIREELAQVNWRRFAIRLVIIALAGVVLFIFPIVGLFAAFATLCMFGMGYPNRPRPPA